VTGVSATPEPTTTASPPTPALGTKACSKCGQVKPLIAFPARRKVCAECEQAARARTQERKETVAWSPELGERISDMMGAGMTVAEITGQPAMPTPRQFKTWRRANPDFDAACLAAETESASFHVDKAKEVLRKVEAGDFPAADGRILFDGHVKLAGTLNPRRYGTAAATIDVTSAGRPLIDFGAAIRALIDALPPPSAGALPAPTELLSPPAAAGGGADEVAGASSAVPATSVDPGEAAAEPDPYADDEDGYELTAEAA